MSVELENEDINTLVKSLENKIYKKPDTLPNFSERQVLAELTKRDPTSISEQDRKIINLAEVRNQLFERDRDKFKTRDMNAVDLLQKLFENSGNDFYRNRYMQELEIRLEEGELNSEQQVTFEQLKAHTQEIRREAVGEIKKHMEGTEEIVDSPEGKGRKLH